MLTSFSRQETWPEVDRLHPPDAGGAQPEGSGAGGGVPAQPLTSGASPAAWMPFAWMRVLWLKGFTHPNGQIQRIVGTSLLGRDWASPAAADYLRSLPIAFLSCDLPQLLAQPHVHKTAPGSAGGGSGGGGGGSRSSEGQGGAKWGGGSSPGAQQQPEVSWATERAARLVGAYCTATGPAAARELLLCLLRPLAERDSGRLQLLTTVEMCQAAAALAGAAGWDQPPAEPGAAVAGGRTASLGRGAEVVGLLRAACRSSRAFGTTHFALWAHRGEAGGKKCLNHHPMAVVTLIKQG